MVGLAAGPARAQDHVTFGLDWSAEAEYGGFYQAIATGIYAKHNLEVTIRQGGPQTNQAQLLLAGKLDFDLASNSFLALNFVQEKLPFVAIAAMFQKDPAVLIAHPGVGHDSFAALKGVPIMIGSDSRASWWPFLRSKFGYTDSQIRPYTFNFAPFLANKAAVQQGYLGSEPFSIKQSSGEAPVVMLLADSGLLDYGSLITTSRKMVAEKPELIQRFINASVEGWYSYLYGDPKPANALIRQANAEMTDALIGYGHDVLKQHGVVDSGDAQTLGIGTMSDDRWVNFARSMVVAGVYSKDIDVRQAYTLQFVNQGVGVKSRPK